MKKLEKLKNYITFENLVFYVISIFRTKSLNMLILYGTRMSCNSNNLRIFGLVKIGRYCTINFTQGSLTFYGENVLGDFSKISCTRAEGSLYLGFGSTANSFCHFGCNGGIRIGENTILGEYVSLHSENHQYGGKIPAKLQGLRHEGIVIGAGCWLGAKCTILDGVFIGDNVVVAAGAVVPKGKYPSNSMIAGVPARVIKIYD
jgi:acetyltransferase-like isoleucine patch superfamily enzyme